MVKEMSQKLTAQMVRNNVVDAAKAPIYAYGIELLLSTLAGIRMLHRDNVRTGQTGQQCPVCPSHIVQ